MGKVKAQLLDEQEHDQFMRDQEPDFDDYALAMKAKDLDMSDIHELINDFAKSEGNPKAMLNISNLISNLLSEHLIKIVEESNIKDDQREWDKVNDEGGHCKNCEHCELTHDAYGTGDSPCMRECTADDPSECPGLL